MFFIFKAMFANFFLGIIDLNDRPDPISTVQRKLDPISTFHRKQDPISTFQSKLDPDPSFLKNRNR